MNAVLAKLEGQQPQGSLSVQDQIGSLYDQLQKQDVAKKLEQNFSQLINPNSTENFSKGELKSVFKTSMLVKGVGAGSAGAIGGVFSGLLGSFGGGFGITGLPVILGGVVIQKLSKGQGKLRDFGEGVLIAGIGLATSGFISPLIGGVLPNGGSTTSSGANGGMAGVKFP